MIWPVIAVASLAALARAASRPSIAFGVGDDAPTEDEQLFVSGLRRIDEPARDFFDSSMWMDANTEEPDEINTLDEEIETDDGLFGPDLWARPELVGGP